MTLPIVTQPDQLTPDWLTAALVRSIGLGEVTAVEFEPVGTGQVGDTYRMKLTLDEAAPDTAPTTVIAKLPASDETSRATGIALRSYELECRFYQQLAPSLPIRTPHCHQVLFDEATHDFTLLFEDLSPAEQGDQIAGCTPDQADIVVQEMTKLHGPRFGDPKLESIDWLNRRNPETTEQIAAIGAMVLPGFDERYGSRLGRELMGVYEKLVPKLGSFMDGTPRPFTIAHGDFRLDNLLFGVGPGAPPVAVVDFQGAGCGSGGGDLAYFLGSGLLPDQRREYERELVGVYHQSLKHQGGDGYGFEDCWQAYRYGTFSGMVVTLVASMMVEQTERGDEMFIAMGSRHAQHALDLDALDLL